MKESDADISLRAKCRISRIIKEETHDKSNPMGH